MGIPGLHQTLGGGCGGGQYMRQTVSQGCGAFNNYAKDVHNQRANIFKAARAVHETAKSNPESLETHMGDGRGSLKRRADAHYGKRLPKRKK